MSDQSESKHKKIGPKVVLSEETMRAIDELGPIVDEALAKIDEIEQQNPAILNARLEYRQNNPHRKRSRKRG